MLAFLRQNFRWIAGGFLLTYLSSFGQTFFISGSVAEWQQKFDLSHGEFGRLYMLATMVSALCLPFLGRLVDVVSEHKLLLLVIPFLAGASLLAAFAPSVALLVLGIFLLRLFGQGMMTHIALTATGRWFDAERGRAVSLVVLGHQGGEATLPLGFALIASALGYQYGWVVSASILLLIGLPLSFWAFRKPRAPQSKALSDAAPARNWTRGEVMRDPIFWVLLTGVLAPAFIGTTIFFHQDYMVNLRQWSPHLFAQGLSLMAVTTTLFALLNGVVIDRFHARAVLPFFLLPLAMACFCLANAASAGMFLLSILFLGVSYGISSTLFGALWPEIYGTKNLGAVRSVIVSAMVLATATGPGLTGTLIDGGFSLPSQLSVMGVYCLVVAFAMGGVAQKLKSRLAPET